MKRKPYIIVGWIVITFLIASYFLLGTFLSKFLPLKYKSKYYDPDEFDSPDAPGSGENMHPDTLKLLDKATERYGQRMQITSGFRTENHNHNVGGVSGSTHLTGRAVDIDTLPSNHQQIIEILKEVGFPRLVIYSGHVHADTDPHKPSGIFQG